MQGTGEGGMAGEGRTEGRQARGGWQEDGMCACVGSSYKGPQSCILFLVSVVVYPQETKKKHISSLFPFLNVSDTSMCPPLSQPDNPQDPCRIYYYQ